MATITTPTTELEAVNIMLGAIGQTPVNSLTGGSALVAIATNMLNAVSRETQTHGWHFNTDLSYPISVDEDGKLPLPSNTLRVDTVGTDRDIDVVHRGGFLYDRVNHTFVFTASVKVDIVICLTFTDLPEAARNYITISAARRFQESRQSSETRSSFNRGDEMRALSLLKKAEGKTANHNMLTGSVSVARVMDRRSR